MTESPRRTEVSCSSSQRPREEIDSDSVCVDAMGMPVRNILLGNGASVSSAAAVVARRTRSGLLRGDNSKVCSRERVKTASPVCSGDGHNEDKSMRKTRTKKSGLQPAVFSSSVDRGTLRASHTRGSPPSRSVRCPVLSYDGLLDAATVPPPSVINIPHLEDVDLHVVNSRSPWGSLWIRSGTTYRSPSRWRYSSPISAR